MKRRPKGWERSARRWLGSESDKRDKAQLEGGGVSPGVQKNLRKEHVVGGNEGKGREHREQREAEIADTVRKLTFLESQGVDVQVAADGKVGGFIPGVDPSKKPTGWDEVVIVYEDLHQMHKSEHAREIILEAWERFEGEAAG